MDEIKIDALLWADKFERTVQQKNKKLRKKIVDFKVKRMSMEKQYQEYNKKYLDNLKVFKKSEGLKKNIQFIK